MNQPLCQQQLRESCRMENIKAWKGLYLRIVEASSETKYGSAVLEAALTL